jgi:hypothetical protein
MTSTKKEGEILKADELGRVRTPKERREAMLDEFEASGLSGAKFAQMVGVKYQTFAYWAARRRRANEQHPGKAVAGPVPQLRWVEAVVEKGSGARAAALTVHLPGGARMEIGDANQAMLAAALLRSLSC